MNNNLNSKLSSILTENSVFYDINDENTEFKADITIDIYPIDNYHRLDITEDLRNLAFDFTRY